MLPSRYAAPGTVFVGGIANDNHVYVFSCKLVKKWVEDGGEGEVGRQQRRERRGAGQAREECAKEEQGVCTDTSVQLSKVCWYAG